MRYGNAFIWSDIDQKKLANAIATVNHDEMEDSVIENASKYRQRKSKNFWINHPKDQEDLNLPLTGKAVNAIRSFAGKGVLVWGARTLDVNRQDWRYLSVRRTVIMIEQSLKIASESYVFQPNEVNTWVAIKGTMFNFLRDQWKQGALAGSSPDDAFSVDVGLGSTMPATDILDGIMRITVKLAVTRPAEFIVITFQQQMQKS